MHYRTDFKINFLAPFVCKNLSYPIVVVSALVLFHIFIINIVYTPSFS